MTKFRGMIAIILILLLCTGCKKANKNAPTETAAESKSATQETAIIEPTFGLTRESPEDETFEIAEPTTATLAPPTQIPTATQPSETIPGSTETTPAHNVSPGGPSSILSGETPED